MHNDEFVMPNNMNRHILDKVQHYSESTKLISKSLISHATSVFIYWHPPEVEWMSFNVDGDVYRSDIIKAEIESWMMIKRKKIYYEANACVDGMPKLGIESSNQSDRGSLVRHHRNFFDVFPQVIQEAFEENLSWRSFKRIIFV